MKLPGVILIDTNIIIESHQTGCWKAIAGAFHLETARKCVIESQDGNMSRPAHLQISEADLTADLEMIHEVSDVELAEVSLNGGAGLDAGERALWAHALTREDAWVLCGPDRASMKFGYDNGFKDRLVSLGGMLSDIRHRPAHPIREHYEQKWLDKVRTKLVLGIL